MGLFLHEITPISAPPRPRVSRLAMWSLIIAATGFLNVVGFIVGPALGIAALMRLRLTRDAGVDFRGRRLAFAAIWLSVGAVATGLGAIFAMLLVADAQLPAPHFHL